MKNIFVADSTLAREDAFGFKESIEIARQLEKLNADIIEMPKVKNAAKDILLIKTVSAFVKNGIISVDAGWTTEDVNNAAAALENAAKPRLRIALPMSVVGMEYTLRKKAPAMLELVKELVCEAKKKVNDVEFCAIDATRADKEFLAQAIKTAVESGADSVTLYDKEGIMFPDEFAGFTEKIIGDAGVGEDVSVGVCCSNISGLAAASSFTALKGRANFVKVAADADITSMDTAIDILRNCGMSCGLKCNLNFTAAKRILTQIKWISSGKSAKSTDTPAPVENKQMMLDSNDDITAVASAVETLGYDLSEEDMSKVFKEFKRIAVKKSITAKDMEAIIASVALQVPPTYELKNYSVQSGNIMSASAQITMNKDGGDIEAIAMGDGPIDAAFKTIEQITGHHYELDDFQIQAVTQGHEAMGGAIVKLRNNGKLYSGKGISTDIIGASIRAYINALNKIVYEEE